MIDPLSEPEPPRPEPPAADLSLLLRQAQGGQGEAFEALYRTLSPGVYGLALRLTGRVHEAEELTQETFVRAWQNRHKLQSAEHLRAWLKRVATNLWLTSLRGRRRQVDPGEDDEVLERRGGLMRRTAAGLRLDLERALARLPDRIRTVVVLFDIYGYRHADIAELLGITVNTSKIHLHRARKRLRESLQ